MELRDAYICAAVRCVPPGDRPTSEEQQACLPYLVSEIGILPRVRTILVLGHVAFQACLRALARIKGEPVKGTFAHGAWYHPGADLPRMVASYHPSPRNTNSRLVREARLVQRGHEELGGEVAAEQAAGSVGPVGRRQADDHQGSRGVAKAGDGPRPVFPAGVTGSLHLSHVFPMLHQARAQAAGDDPPLKRGEPPPHYCRVPRWVSVAQLWVPSRPPQASMLYSPV